MPIDLITLTGTTVTHDETAGLQNAMATPGVPGDANDEPDGQWVAPLGDGRWRLRLALHLPWLVCWAASAFLGRLFR